MLERLRGFADELAAAASGAAALAALARLADVDDRDYQLSSVAAVRSTGLAPALKRARKVAFYGGAA